MKNAIVTPIANEIKNICQFHNEMKLWVCKNNAKWVTVFDNSCTDGTKEWLEKNKGEETIIIENRQPFKKLAGAYISGSLYSIDNNFDKIVEVDVGHPIDQLDGFINSLDEYPVVFGTRYGDGTYNAHWIRKIISAGGTIISKRFLGLPFSDCTSGLQGFTISVAKKMDWDNFISRGHFYQTEFKYYCKNMKFKEIPFNYSTSESSISLKQVINALKDVYILKTTGRPIQ